VLVTMALARAVGASAGIAGLILATAPEYWWMARSGTPDTAAASATALALTFFLLAWHSGRRSLLAAAAVAAGTAFWLKSLLGVGLASITIAAFLAWAGKGRLRTRDLLWAAAATGSGAALWLVLLWRAESGGAVAFFVVRITSVGSWALRSKATSVRRSITCPTWRSTSPRGRSRCPRPWRRPGRSEATRAGSSSSCGRA